MRDDTALKLRNLKHPFASSIKSLACSGYCDRLSCLAVIKKYMMISPIVAIKMGMDGLQVWDQIGKNTQG